VRAIRSDVGSDALPGNEFRMNDPRRSPASRSNGRRRDVLVGSIETLLLALAFAFHAGSPPPDVNEAHYLGKALHFWDRSWCRGDLFLESADAHPAFYLTFGWLGPLVGLSGMALVGRAVIWTSIAAGWVYLSRAVSPRFPAGLLSGILWLLLVHHGHMAGEWVIGGVEAKGPAFALVLFGLARAARRDWLTCWWFWGGAAAFHVLVGGWVMIAALPVALLIERQEDDAPGRTGWRAIAWGLAFAMPLALVGLIPGLGLEKGLDGDALALARSTYVYLRLPHHLVISQFDPTRILWFVALLLLWVMVLGGVPTSRAAMRIHAIAFGSLAIAAVGIALDRYVVWSGDLTFGANWLRYYWFRCSDVMVPTAIALGAAGGAASRGNATPTTSSDGSIRERHAGRIGLAVIASLSIFALWASAMDRRADGRPGADRQSLPRGENVAATHQLFDDWKRLGAWVDRNLPSEAIVITPRDQQTFKWYAQRAEVANRKDVPQDAASLIEWLRRIDRLDEQPLRRNQVEGVDFGLLIYSDETLRELGRDYGARWIVVPRYQVYLRGRDSTPTRLKRVFPPPDAPAAEQQNYWVILSLDASDSRNDEAVPADRDPNDSVDDRVGVDERSGAGEQAGVDDSR